MLRTLGELENPPSCLTEMAYGLCSAVCKNHESFQDWKSLLLPLLEMGFRRFGPKDSWMPVRLTHTEHHRKLADVVFESGDPEAIADLLRAWTIRDDSYQWADGLLGICTRRLIDLHSLVPFSPRLRGLVIQFIERVGYKGFEEVGVERFVELLNYLRVGIDDLDYMFHWIPLLLDAVQSSVGFQHLSNRSWELLVELILVFGATNATFNRQIMTSLLDGEEWDKLECWIGVVWMAWPPETDEMVEDLRRAMVSLFRQRPGAAEKLEGWMGLWSQEQGSGARESFQRACEQAHKAAHPGAL